MIPFCLYKKRIKPPVFQSWLEKIARAPVWHPVPNCKAVTGWAAAEAAGGEAEANAAAGSPVTGVGMSGNRLLLPSFAAHQLRKIFYTKAFPWFFEMVWLPESYFLKIQKYMWLKYSRNMRLIKSSRATTYAHVGCTNPNIECTDICLIYTLSQSNQPRGLLAEFSVLPIDPDFLQGVVYEVFWRHCLVIVKELSFTVGSLK